MSGPIGSLLRLGVLLAALGGCAVQQSLERPPGSVRIASFNASLSGRDEGEIISRLAVDVDPQAMAIGAILQRVRPDVVLINEFDYDPEGRNVRRFVERYLARSLHGQEPIHYPYHYTAPVNTGIPSGFDLDGDGRTSGPADAWGYGHFPGQYGMLVLSRYPIEHAAVRSFRTFKWRHMPGALRPLQADGQTPYWPEAVWAEFPLSSKSHWDVPITIDGRVLHVLAAHPTPPAFDGPEDRNGRRNHDEIRLWADYLSGAEYLYDDQGRGGGLAAAAMFVIVGDYNADPDKGQSVPGAIRQLLDHPRVDARFVPSSPGAEAAVAPEQRARHRHDTADFGEPTPGNLRVDYVLPARGLRILGGGVYWPTGSDPDAEWVRASDHRLVWLDLAWPD